MSRFKVGQRVRVICPNAPCNLRSYSKHPAVFLGCEATVTGTMEYPNAGFATEGGDTSIRPDGYWRSGMVHQWQLVPLGNEGLPAEERELELAH